MHRSGLVVVAVLALLLLIGGYFVGRAQARTDDIMRFLRVEYLPHPRDIVNLAQGTPYTVPAGKILVLRDFAISDTPAILQQPNPNSCEIATGLTVAANGQVIWKTGGGVFRAWNFFGSGAGNSMSERAWRRDQRTVSRRSTSASWRTTAKSSRSTPSSELPTQLVSWRTSEPGLISK